MLMKSQKKKEDDENSKSDSQSVVLTLSDVIPEMIDRVLFEDVIGLENVKSSVTVGNKNGNTPNIFAFGPPGCGKTYIAKAIATVLKLNYVVVESRDILAKTNEKTCKLLKKKFDTARSKLPCIMFFDEFDTLISTPQIVESQMNAVRRQMLIEMDHLLNENSQVMCMGITNRPWDIDSSIRSRFDSVIYFPLPEPKHRREFLERHLAQNMHVLTEADVEAFVNSTEMYSFSNLRDVVTSIETAKTTKFDHATHFHKKSVYIPDTHTNPAPLSASGSGSSSGFGSSPPSSSSSASASASASTSSSDVGSFSGSSSSSTSSSASSSDSEPSSASASSSDSESSSASASASASSSSSFASSSLSGSGSFSSSDSRSSSSSTSTYSSASTSTSASAHESEYALPGRRSERYVPCAPRDPGAVKRAVAERHSRSHSSHSSSSPSPSASASARKLAAVIDAKVLLYAVHQVRPQTTAEDIAHFEEFAKSFAVRASEEEAPNLF